MIKKELLLKILNKNLDIGNYILIDMIARKEDLSDLWGILKIRGWREALIRKGIIQEIEDSYILTDYGESLYNSLLDIEKVENDTENIDKSDELNIDIICNEIVKEVNLLIFNKTGKNRLRLKSGMIYNYSVKDLKKRILEYITKFKNSNFTLIKKAIIEYTEDILEGKINYPRTIKYFIWKEIVENGKSKIISDMNIYIETNVNEKTIIKDTRKLF